MRVHFLLAFTSVLFCSSCYQKIEVIEVEDFSNVHIGFKGMQSDLYVHVYNPNRVSINVESAEISLRVGEVDAGDVWLKEAMTLVARDTSLVHLRVETRQGAIGKILLDNIGKMFGSEEIPFSAEGIIIGKSWGLKIEVPVHHSQNLVIGD